MPRTSIRIGDACGGRSTSGAGNAFLPLLELLAGSSSGRAFIFQIALDLLLQRLQHARHRDQHRHPFAAYGAMTSPGLNVSWKIDRTTHQLRQKNSQKLPEHVAEWQ